jgi:Zn-dependent protease
MSDPRSWAFPLGRLFGITIKIHWLFPVMAIALVLRAAYGPKNEPQPDGAWIDAALIVTFLFISVLFHEFGHCFAARWVNGDASEVLLWPLGGLAYVDVPNTPRANFIVAAAGPAVNLGLCVVCALALGLLGEHHLQPPWNPLGYPGRFNDTVFPMTSWGGAQVLEITPYAWQALVSRFFWVNWLGFLINALLVGFPLDAGRMFHAVVWSYSDSRRATIVTGFVGCLITTSIVGIYSIVQGDGLLFSLAVIICLFSYYHWKMAEEGMDESLFGYDFSQGYTSLERDEPEPAAPVRRQSWWQRWRQRRAAQRIQRELESREADERRMDELLEKISVRGKESLTEEEKRFMIRFSERYRNRNNS